MLSKRVANLTRNWRRVPGACRFEIKNLLLPLLCLVAFLSVIPAPAQAGSVCVAVTNGVSCTGSLDTPEDIFTDTFTLVADSTITVQTYGFGGGTNAAGTPIPAGGFDSLVALFSGIATDATILTDSSSNPIASADSLSTYSPGCPPAGLVTVGSVPGNCGDNTLVAALGPGTYTLLLTDADFLSVAVDPGVSGAIDLTDTVDNYFDLTGGVFQTCVDPEDCNTDNGTFAVDILASSPGSFETREPGESGVLLLLAILLGALQWVRRRASGAGA